MFLALNAVALWFQPKRFAASSKGSAATTTFITTPFTVRRNGIVEVFALLLSCITLGIDATIKWLGVIHGDGLMGFDADDV
tara:strand:- start:25 stop:267 length:243 start_codon:yes stop_codon:yes gene_type:complete